MSRDPQREPTSNDTSSCAVERSTVSPRDGGSVSACCATAASPHGWAPGTPPSPLHRSLRCQPRRELDPTSWLACWRRWRWQRSQGEAR